ncbi:MAG: ROK family transcriptional regulator [Clostridia bacterium]|nr:ROK family transcriptional regulator [Clostridia bacterium]
MKLYNQSLLLDCIRQGKHSRASLAATTGLTKAAVTIIVDNLIRQGIVNEIPSEEPTIGRPPIYLALNNKARFFLGINISRCGWSAGIIDLSGTELSSVLRQGYPTPRSFKADIASVVCELLAACGATADKIVGIGVTTPGPVDVKQRRILNPPNFDAWHNYPIGDVLDGIFDVPVYVENVSNAVALSEKYFGNARDCANYMTVLINEGIGSGIVIDGSIFRGHNELGHTSIYPYGKPCNCGNIGCLECYASIPALLEGTGFEDWNSASQDTETVLKEARYLSIAVTNACNLFRFEKIILSGSIQSPDDPILNTLASELSRRSMSDTPIIVAGKVTSDTLISATPAYDRFFTVL